MSDDKKAPTLLIYPPVGLVAVVAVLPPEEEGKAALYKLETRQGRLPSLISIYGDKAEENGMRPLSARAQYREACEILRQCKRFSGRVRGAQKAYSKEAWRAQMASGELLAQARIVRDFYRGPDDKPLQSVERDVFQEALLRLCAESAAILGWTVPEKIDVMKKKMLRLLTLPRRDLTEKEENQTRPDVNRSVTACDPNAASVFNKGQSMEYRPSMIPSRFGGCHRFPG